MSSTFDKQARNRQINQENLGQQFGQQWWASLKHGGMLLSATKLSELFGQPLARLPHHQAEKLRRAITRFQGDAKQLGGLLDFVLEELAGFPAAQWQKATEIGNEWSFSAVNGDAVKPRRIWVGDYNVVLPLFVAERGSTEKLLPRLGVGHGRKAVARVIEWLRNSGQALALLTNGQQWRLIHAGSDYDAWCEWDSDFWFEEGRPSQQIEAWRQLLAPGHFTPLKAGETSSLLQAIQDSRKGQAELSSVLGERVRQAVELLITASQSAIEEQRAEGVNVSNRDLYLAATRVVMRCIITLFAEARMLLPTDNRIYQQAYSLEGLRQQLDRRAGGRGRERLTQGRGAWPRLLSLFSLVYHGSAHEALPVPEYSGGLFQPGSQRANDDVLRALAVLENNTNPVTDADIYQILNLLTRTRIKVRQGRGSTWVEAPVDFSDLSSEYIGILYEGLLDYELKQADNNDPMIFLNIGNQPALPLSRLEAMNDRAIKNLFEALKKKDDDGSDEEEVTDEAAASEEAAEDKEPEQPEEPVVEEDSEHQTLIQRANEWLLKAVDSAKLAKKSRGNSLAAQQRYEENKQREAKKLRARLIAPGEFYLVRWGGTRKGAGTFYTRPQLATPTVRRTLQPLVYNPVRSEVNPRTGLQDVVEWSPKTPEEILDIKVCDPAMGSGSFLASCLRYLTQALFESLHVHNRLSRKDDGSIARLADGYPLDHPSQQTLPVPPEHEAFEEQLKARLKRHVVERCLYGVDFDPLAVELGRMALWVETMDRSLPFGFLDHKLKVGNSLLGCWLDNFQEYPVMAWSREGGDKDLEKKKPEELREHYWVNDKGVKKGDRFTKAIRKIKSDIIKPEILAVISGQRELGDDAEVVAAHGVLLKVFNALHRLPVHESEKRARLYQEKILDNPSYHQLKNRLDLWCALWVWPGDKIDQAPTPQTFANPSDESLALAAAIVGQHRFFHWELEFPDVFTPERTGFDAIVGNPPWEIQKPNSKEFFSNIDPLYRAYGKQEALNKQVGYFEQDAQIEAEWIDYKAHLKSLSNWVKYAGYPFGDGYKLKGNGSKDYDFKTGLRGAGADQFFARWWQQRRKHQSYADTAHPYLHQGSADLNTYKLFLELGHALLNKQGRMGFVVPSGVYTDKGTTELRNLFLSQCDWQWLFGFENREGIFDIHRSFKFCPLIVQKGGETLAIRSAFMHRDISDWEQAEQYALAYSREQVEEFSPYSKAILEIRSEKDLQVLQKLYANGVLLGDQSDKGWGIKYATEFHMTNDSKLFPELPKWEAKGYARDHLGYWCNGETYALPVYNAKMFSLWDFCSSGWISGKGRGANWENIDYPKVLKPEYLMDRDVFLAEANRSNSVRLLFKDISTAIHQRTMMCSLAPDLPTVNASPVLSVDSNNDVILLQAVLASFALDYVAKFKIGYLHLNYFIIAELPLIEPKSFSGCLNEVKTLAIRLGCPNELFANIWNESYSGFCDKAWRSWWAVTPYERLRIKAILDALAAYLFGLELSSFKWVLRETDYPKELLSSKAFCARLDQKAFWRVGKSIDPELRHTILAIVAFEDLLSKGMEGYLEQNNGEGWMIPETLCLADYGLGHDERSKQHQPVASRLGPRFYDWQLEQNVEASWEECRRHAELINKIVPPLPENEVSKDETKTEALQANLF